ncbi:hypothetical protein Vi05172_g8266 [Venturia inaequalis]|uniref:Suppressor of anucleate metulae protein B n=1 Tax=Venturia inaequalis TaxID=5025 RepID=A0A8H3VTH6_VENIN|nr:hypothetical protein EG327_002994 [Venturia inaequalis]RDI81765.1 hypothetical protein Vi05172_g8266 [Venturia inaequalis]
MYVIKDVDGKGKGLVATEKIPRGTRILSEEPIITIRQNEQDGDRLRNSIRQQIDRLDEAQRQNFLSMHNIHPHKTVAQKYHGIIGTNALPIEADGIGGGIFLEACRINHACDNNAQKHWNSNIKRHTVHALRDIEEGEEITIYYLGANKSRKDRRESLRERFGFECSCRLCSLPPDQILESDKRVVEIARLDGILGEGGLMEIMSSPLQCLRHVETMIHLYEEQGQGDAGIPRSLLDAAQIAIAHGDLARGRTFAERAISGWRMSGGDDCEEVLEHGYLVVTPSKLRLYGLSMKWKTGMDDVPVGLDAAKFDAWLWRREKSELISRPMSRTDREIFPAFIDLPNRPISRSVANRPNHHYCFLGEITDSSTFHHLELQLKDIDNRKIPLHFYTEGLGGEWTPLQIKKGYTVAVLNAQRHVFIFGDPGIRHEDADMLRIFPCSLAKFHALHSQAQEFSEESEGGARTCHGCGRTGLSLQKCAKCFSYWYCDKACQEVGWKEKGHRGDCKPLQDEELRKLLGGKWCDGGNGVGFPL